jgi:hypothetical protein
MKKTGDEKSRDTVPLTAEGINSNFILTGTAARDFWRLVFFSRINHARSPESYTHFFPEFLTAAAARSDSLLYIHISIISVKSKRKLLLLFKLFIGFHF